MNEPSSIQELSEIVRSKRESAPLAQEISLARLNTVIRHTAHDMTASVECGITLGKFQERLSAAGQWLPVDPPGANSLTIRELLDRDSSGPRRFGFGTVRDWVIGMTAVLADGRVIKSGGNVVKNVAGYDLHKLFIGANSELGVIAQATFKVNPLPDLERFTAASFSSLDAAFDVIDSIWTSPLTPHVLDLYSTATDTFTLVLGFCGSVAQVEWQCSQLPDHPTWQHTDLSYDTERLKWSVENRLQRKSVAPSDLRRVLAGFAGVPFIVRAGNGTINFPGGAADSSKRGRLDERIRDLFGAFHKDESLSMEVPA